MESYPLEALLAVRHYREEGAQRNVRSAEQSLREAEKAEETKKRELEEFKIWRHDEEERRYDAIMERPMTITQLDDFKAGLALLADMELQKLDAVEKAGKQVEDSAKALDSAKSAAKQAQKNTAKIQAHKDIWQEEAKKEAERLADLELEEFRPLSRKGAEAEGEDV